MDVDLVMMSRLDYRKMMPWIDLSASERACDKGHEMRPYSFCDDNSIGSREKPTGKLIWKSIVNMIVSSRRSELCRLSSDYCIKNVVDKLEKYFDISYLFYASKFSVYVFKFNKYVLIILFK